MYTVKITIATHINMNKSQNYNVEQKSKSLNNIVRLYCTNLKNRQNFK